MIIIEAVNLMMMKLWKPFTFYKQDGKLAGTSSEAINDLHKIQKDLCLLWCYF